MTTTLRFIFAVLLCALAAAASGVRGQTRPAPLDFDVMEKSIEELQRAMQAGEVTSRQLVDLYLARIDAYDQQGPALNAIVAVNPARARGRRRARRGAQRAGGSARPLHGIPVLVKDNYETIEMPTTAGSIALASASIPARDAFQVQRLKDAGAVILGKTNMHELAAGIFTVGSRFGQTRNPYDLDRNPGGSSGGTGAAVAANFAAGGMGSDTCGSIRNPGLAQQSRRPARHAGTVEPHRHRAAVEHAGHRRPDRADHRGPGDHARRDGRRRSGRRVDGGERRAHSGVVSQPRLRADALKGARIGVVRSLFGTAPEDQEVTTVVSRRSTALKKAGAEVIDVVDPRPRRSAARQLDDQRRLQVRSGRVSGRSPATRR